MNIEKEVNNLIWYELNELKIRVKVMDKKCTVCVILENYNISLKLCMYDIIERINNDICLDVKVIKDFNEQRVFEVCESKYIDLINYIEKFIKDWEIKITEGSVSKKEYISDEVWYSV